MQTQPARGAGELQAQKFGVRIKLAANAAALLSRDGVHEVTFDDGEAVTARSVIIATGARYNRLRLDRLTEFEGVGVYYAATQAEAQACGTEPVAVVGGGNSRPTWASSLPPLWPGSPPSPCSGCSAPWYLASSALTPDPAASR